MTDSCAPTRRDDSCTPATCPNGKCNQTGECIERTAEDMRRLGESFPRVKSPPLVPNATTIAAMEELERGGGTRCVGCDGYDCDKGCAYPGAAPRQMSGFWSGLTADQQRDALAHRGDDTMGPVRQRLIDADSATRKTFPMARGLLDYFPDALAAVAQVSHIGNEKHNPGETMHHARGKSMDHADCIVRHLVGRGGFDGDTRESAALAWRALALLQEELEAEMGLPLPRGARAAT